jgi:hypothetical protein
MLNLEKLIIEHFVGELRAGYQRNYGGVNPEYANIIAWTGYLALENISNSDILYHNIEHTIMVTLVGQEILRGKHLSEGGVAPKDWLHFIVALLCHDIGYVKGICKDDGDGVYATGVDEKTVEIPQGGTDAALTPYHVDRSKLFIQERFGKGKSSFIDADAVASCIEMTRAPIPAGDFYKDTSGFPGLARAADYIGQLGDPNYLLNIPALFYEFEEIGMNKKIGYKNPGEMRKNYAKFYWNVVSHYIQDGLRHLRVTQEGKHWIANLYSHIFYVEHSDQQ